MLLLLTGEGAESRRARAGTGVGQFEFRFVAILTGKLARAAQRQERTVHSAASEHWRKRHTMRTHLLDMT